MYMNRTTKQKKALEQALKQTSDLFTAEEMLVRVKKIDSRVSLATVYRFLKLLLKQKTLHSYTCERRLVYSKNKKDHVHFICEECQSVIHFDVDSLDFVKKKLPGELCHFEIEVSGICLHCLKKIKNEEKP